LLVNAINAAPASVAAAGPCTAEHKVSFHVNASLV
jgi:hypothetical protein